MRIVLEPGDEEWLKGLIRDVLNERESERPRAWLTLPEAAERLRAPESTLRWWRHAGKGPSQVKRGRRIYYAADEIDEWMRGHDTAPPPPK